MKISLSPMRRDDTLTVEKNGDRLRINGELFNFGPLPEGGDLDASFTNCEWIVGSISRINGDLHICLVLPHGPNPSNSVAFPEPLENVPDGIVNLPFDPPEETPIINEDENNVDA